MGPCECEEVGEWTRTAVDPGRTLERVIAGRFLILDYKVPGSSACPYEQFAHSNSWGRLCELVSAEFLSPMQ
jgi:hypothetical protein